MGRRTENLELPQVTDLSVGICLYFLISALHSLLRTYTDVRRFYELSMIGNSHLGEFKKIHHG